tara:strand:+ start:249 stop:908 length:660 start_codon:yes stop_codon:yes gene_type:complete
MANATNQNTNTSNEVTKGFEEALLCIQCKEYSFIEGVCNDGCDSDVDLELHTEHLLGGFDHRDCPCSECRDYYSQTDPTDLDVIEFVNILSDSDFLKMVDEWAYYLIMEKSPNWKVYEIGEIGSASVVRDLSKNMMSINVSTLDAALTADRYGDRPVVKLSEIEYLALLDRSTLTESYLDVDLIDDFEELDKLTNKQIRSESGVNTSFTQIHFRNANGR